MPAGDGHFCLVKKEEPLAEFTQLLSGRGAKGPGSYHRHWRSHVYEPSLVLIKLLCINYLFVFSEQLQEVVLLIPVLTTRKPERRPMNDKAVCFKSGFWFCSNESILRVGSPPGSGPLIVL